MRYATEMFTVGRCFGGRGWGSGCADGSFGEKGVEDVMAKGGAELVADLEGNL